jgi:acetyltransferase
VAVVGASPNPSFVSGILKNLLRWGFEGPVYAVNPRYDRVLDAPCFPTVADLPEPVDLVVVGIANRFVPALLEQAEAKGVGALDIVTSGYSEMGTEAGRQRQAELAAWAERTGIPVGGPNCFGLLNALTGAVAISTVFEKLPRGCVGAILQSGMMAPSVLVPLAMRDIGLTVAATTGNEANVDVADYLDYLVEQEETRVIACFTEQIRTPDRFLQACERAAAARKPIVMLKIGRSEAARQSAMAHTGSLVGSDAVIDAVLRKHGVTRVRSVDELAEAVAVFHAPRLPRGGGVAPIMVSGGGVGLLNDLAQDIGVTFPPLTEATRRRLEPIVPEYGTVGNPLDITGQGVFETDILKGSIDALAEAGNVDIIVYGRGFPSYLDLQSPAGEILAQAADRHPDVLLLVLALTGGPLLASQTPDVPNLDPSVHLAGVPFLQGAENGLRAIAALTRYAEFQRGRERSGARRRSDQMVQKFAPMMVQMTGGRPLTERESKAILGMYGIPTTREQLASTVEEALAAAGHVGYPVALKVEAPGLLHKTEAGAVALDIGGPDELMEAYYRVLESAARAAPELKIHGVVVQRMMPKGVELILGMKRDAQFGPVVACGLGGIFVELLNDVQLLLPPVDEREARAAIDRLRGRSLLDGVRGTPAADVDALVDVVCRFSELAAEVGTVAREIDINPLVVLPPGQGACAVDALIVPG